VQCDIHSIVVVYGKTVEHNVAK